MTGSPPARAFIAALHSHSVVGVDIDGLVGRLADCERRVRLAWPGLSLDAVEFAAHLGRQCTRADDLASLRAEELFLAWSCAKGNERAVRALEGYVGADIRRALQRLHLDEQDIGDVTMTVMQRLIVDRPPKIVSYSGRGSLAQWICVVAAREALASKRTAARRRDLLEAAQEGLTLEDPELAFVKSHYRAEFQVAFGHAIEALASKDRNVLVYRFVEGLNLDQLAAATGVHRATAARWLVRIRTQLLESTRGGLRQRLGVSEAELDSIVQLIASNFEVSVQRLLRS